MNRLQKSLVSLCAFVAVSFSVGCGPTEAPEELPAGEPPVVEQLPVKAATDCRDTGCPGTSYCCHDVNDAYGCYGFSRLCSSYLCQDPRYNQNYHCWGDWCVPNGLTCIGPS